jgi:hypothetical protein
MLAARLSVVLIAAALSPLARSETIVVPTQVSTIQAAIDRAQPLDVVLVEPGTYRESIALKTQVSVLGRETARTLLQPQSASDPTVQISLANDLLFSGFTLTGASTGIEVSASLSVQITNVVFASASEAAIDVVNSEVDVANNVFFDNAIAVRRNTTTVEITSNIFRSNDVTMSSGVDNNANVEANCWSNNADLRPVGGSETGYGLRPTVGEPLFVAEGDRDFHLKEGSPCIDAGIGVDVIDSTVADAGAYGGPFADAFPMPVTGVTLTDASTGGKAAFTAAWSPNASYLVTHSTVPGGYRVYYKQGSPGPPYNGTDAGGGMQPSPIDVGNVTTFTLSDLAPVKPLPTPTQLLGATPHNEAVELSWQAAAGASGYRIHYGVDSTAENQVDAGNVTTFSVTGLTNGTFYRFAVGTLSSATYYVVVTAHDSTPQRHESAESDEVSVQAGGTEEAALSNELTARPEQTVAYPTLPDEGGCFIATAAYGADWQAEVQALRDFRDRYLLPHAAGRWFVGRYYELSPNVAAYINDHPSTKPLVRSLLTPLVVVALFLLGSGAIAKSGVAALLGSLAVLELGRRKRDAARERGAPLRC